MTDARTVIDAIKYTEFDNMGMANDTTIGETFGAEVILAALAEAGMEIISTKKLTMLLAACSGGDSE